MNRFLARSLGFLNGLLAIVYILAFAVIGLFLGPQMGIGEGPGLGLGLLVGWLIAVVVCGGLAILLNIRDSLASIAQSMAKGD